MTIDITPEAVKRASSYRGTTEQLINALEAMPPRGGISGQVVAAEASIVIRALSSALTTSQAETAAAYAVATHTLDRWATNLRYVGFSNASPVVIEQCSAMIRALTPADSKAALDRMIAEARADGMREAAAIPAVEAENRRHGGSQNLMAQSPIIETAILTAITKGKDHE